MIVDEVLIREHLGSILIFAKGYF